MNKGEIAWQIPNGDTPPDDEEQSGAQGRDDLRRPAARRSAGLLVTKTLLLRARARAARRCSDAYDKATGADHLGDDDTGGRRPACR